MATNAISDMLRNTWKPSKEVEKRWCERISCCIGGVYTIGSCISRFWSEKVYSKWGWNVGIETHRQILQRHLAPNKNSGKKGPSRGIVPKSVHLMSVVFTRQNSRTDHMRRPWPKNDAPAKQRGIWLKNSDKTWFYIPGDVKGNVDALSLQKDQKSENSSSIQEHRCTWWAKTN